MKYLIVDVETYEVVAKFDNLSSAKDFIKGIPDFVIYVRRGNPK